MLKEGIYTCVIDENGVSWSNNLENISVAKAIGASLVFLLSRSTGQTFNEVAMDMAFVAHGLDYRINGEGKDE